ncbi:GNAT family N-acetyltransferase [Hymenobacter sp. DH14]|uniref:GNAT family N-acetyltransferase n=1 Tax=Hymenobacter cyanobacteriorum TaxID=2926463 RepID=A0A9X1VKC4_9BACT|nr:GNAT family protein [Hymenobacter cyanobacteriorum]MCI1187931.1 GNAT family N-acetyltransferase [Hymenobacter cyanobacteriorum]
MIPLITQTPRLQILAASRALLTAELQKPQYFPVLLGAALPADWNTAQAPRATLEQSLEALTAGGRDAAGWHGWYALRKADDTTPRTLVGAASFLGPPDAAGVAEITFAIAADWRGQGLGTELVAGLVQQAADTGLVRRLVARPAAANEVAQRVLLRNGFEPAGTAEDSQLRFERAVEPSPPPALPAGA